jgi:hypothetical protein
MLLRLRRIWLPTHTTHLHYQHKIQLSQKDQHTIHDVQEKVLHQSARVPLIKYCKIILSSIKCILTLSRGTGENRGHRFGPKFSRLIRLSQQETALSFWCNSRVSWFIQLNFRQILWPLVGNIWLKDFLPATAPWKTEKENQLADERGGGGKDPNYTTAR